MRRVVWAGMGMIWVVGGGGDEDDDDINPGGLYGVKPYECAVSENVQGNRRVRECTYEQ